MSQKIHLNDFSQTTYDNSLLDVFLNKIVAYCRNIDGILNFDMPISGFGKDSLNEKWLKGFCLVSIHKFLFQCLFE